MIVTSGAYHAKSVPWWLPSGGRAVIPYALEEEFRHAPPLAAPPPPRAIFTSNPLRGLDWLLDRWERQIHPALPQAELHLYCGPTVYGVQGERKAEAMNAVLSRAEGMAAAGVRRFAPLPRGKLIPALRGARIMLYRGDPGETFCRAVAEAQVLGVPAVVQPIGALAERVVDGVTGFLAPSDAAFAQRAIALLTDDTLWRRQHEAALSLQRGLGPDEVAQRFEAFLQ